MDEISNEVIRNSNPDFVKVAMVWSAMSWPAVGNNADEILLKIEQRRVKTGSPATITKEDVMSILDLAFYHGVATRCGNGNERDYKIMMGL